MVRVEAHEAVRGWRGGGIMPTPSGQGHQRVDELDAEHQDDIITVVIPEFVTSWRSQWLHNGSAFALKARLLHRPHTAVVSVPIHMNRETSREDF